MDRRPGSSRVICSTRQPGIGQSLFMLRSMGSDASPLKSQPRPAQSTQRAGEPAPWTQEESGMTIRRSAALGAALVGALALGAAEAQAQGTQVGNLSCQVSGGIGLIVTSQKEL